MFDAIVSEEWGDLISVEVFGVGREAGWGGADVESVKR